MVKVIIDTPERNTTLIYKTGYFCIDPIVLIDNNGELTGFFPSTEIEKAKKSSLVNHFADLSINIERLKQTGMYKTLKSSVVVEWAKLHNVGEITVPETFPLIEADYIRENGISVIPEKDPFYKEREVKNSSEITYIKENSLKNVIVMDKVKNIIGSSSVSNDGKLFYNGAPLTSEYLQSFIINSFTNEGLITQNVIAAPGDQGCDPHEYGSGIIYAGQSIVVDIYPKSRYNQYYTDMTRTFCKGRASCELTKLYNTVLDCQLMAIDMVSSGVSGRDIHSKVDEYFTAKGYKTGVINGVLQGFFHSTGHGVGLDCHESPYISKNGTILKENMTVTVEPGLYYLGVGGVRIEDLVLVKNGGCEVLTPYEKRLEIE